MRRCDLTYSASGILVDLLKGKDFLVAGWKKILLTKEVSGTHGIKIGVS
jgi:hypothetical protein